MSKQERHELTEQWKDAIALAITETESAYRREQFLYFAEVRTETLARRVAR